MTFRYEEACGVTMKLVGLTGGIGCGKSTVAGLLVERGAVAIDTDAVNREIQEPGTSVFDAIVARWGDRVVAADGRLDRQALSGAVFGDNTEMAALMAITVPAVDATVRECIEAWEGTDAIVVLESAILPNGSRLYGMAARVVVDAPETVAIERLSRRGLSEADARARIAKQPSREQRLEGADFVVDNGGDRERLERQLDGLWAWIATLPDDTYERADR
jgi:dephospho-CoA kinase